MLTVLLTDIFCICIVLVECVLFFKALPECLLYLVLVLFVKISVSFTSTAFLFKIIFYYEYIYI